MMDLGDLAQKWIQEARVHASAPTGAYTDLIFSFGMARLGEHDASKELLARAGAVLTKLPEGTWYEKQDKETHTFLLRAYGWRIGQALEGKPHQGPLPADQVEAMGQLDRMPRYLVDRLRQHSRILEPASGVDPYAVWGARISGLGKGLNELREMTDARKTAEGVDRLLAGVPGQSKGTKESLEIRARILQVALDLAPSISEEFGRTMLRLIQEILDALPEARDHQTLSVQAALVGRALSVATVYKIGEVVQSFAAWVRKALQSARTEQKPFAVQWLAGPCIFGFAALGMRVALEQFLIDLERALQVGEEVNALANHPAYRRSRLRALLDVAAGWYDVGQDQKAEPAVEAARTLLFKNELAVREQTDLACAYARTVGYAPAAIAQGRLEELFSRLEGVRDIHTTNSHYSLSHLDVIEAVVLAAVHNAPRSIVA
jgi:hypothetical protein